MNWCEQLTQCRVRSARYQLRNRYWAQKCEELRKVELARLAESGYRLGDRVKLISPGLYWVTAYRGIIKQRKSGAIYVRVGRENYDFWKNPWEADNGPRA